VNAAARHQAVTFAPASVDSVGFGILGFSLDVLSERDISRLAALRP
jgi:hypothetical protein